MPIEPRHIHSVAITLSAAADFKRTKQADAAEIEAIERSAVSRLYYSAYTDAEGYASEKGFKVSDCPYPQLGSHQRLWEWWFEDEDPDKTLSALGADLHQARVRADYRIWRPFLRRELDEAMTKATMIIERLAEKRSGGASDPS